MLDKLCNKFVFNEASSAFGGGGDTGSGEGCHLGDWGLNLVVVLGVGDLVPPQAPEMPSLSTSMGSAGPAAGTAREEATVLALAAPLKWGNRSSAPGESGPDCGESARARGEGDERLDGDGEEEAEEAGDTGENCLLPNGL